MELPPIITLLITDLLSPLGPPSILRRKARRAQVREAAGTKQPEETKVLGQSRGRFGENAARLGLGFRGFGGEGFRV